MIKKTAVVGLALPLLAVSLLAWAPWERSNPGAVSASSAPSSVSNVSHETTVVNDTVVASAGTESLILAMTGLRVVDGRPSNMTHALVEFTWSTPTSAAELDTWEVSVTTEGKELNDTVSQEDPIRLWVSASEYRGGALWVYFGPTGSEDRPVGAVAAAEVQIHVTTFSGGPPDRGFSALEG